MRKCNECKNFKYTVIGKGAGYKCSLKDKPMNYLHKCKCNKFERK